MKITQSEIVISAVKPEQYPEGGLPEFALAGRSNVGKSSFINKMINRKALARISSKPGKTQTLNFYLLNESIYFVDVPGYGYAKVSKSERAAWGKMIETYMTDREPLKAVVLIVDLRHPPTKDDIMMYDFLKHFDISQEIIYADFNWDAILEMVKRHKISFKAIPKYPEVRRDFALLLNDNINFKDIHAIANKTERQLLKNVSLFDVYQGKNLPQGKKSYAVSFTLQDEHKTLTDKQIDKIMSSLQVNFEKELGAELR